MKLALLALALFAGQAITLQDKPVVHLKAHTNFIDETFNGSRLELIQGPPVIYLPMKPPKPDAAGEQWTVDVKNFGPGPVTVMDHSTFSVPLPTGMTIHIVSNGRIYLLKH